MAEGELLPVPTDMVPKLWTGVKQSIRGPRGMGDEAWNCAYDVKRLHGRLLVGMDRLWIAVITKGCNTGKFAGIVITSLGPPPPDRPHKLFFIERSLTVHFIAGHLPRAWMDDAIEKIALYGKENGCRQIFVLARRNWQSSLKKGFFGRFARVGIARDRMVANGRDPRNALMRPGHFRLLEPLPPGLAYSLARRHRRKVYIQPKEKT